MYDIKWIRENQAEFEAGLTMRGVASPFARLVELDENRRAHVGRVQEAQQRRNSASKEIGAAMGSGDKDLAEKLKLEVAELKTYLVEAEAVERGLDSLLKDVLSNIPNIPLDGVPEGKDEADNVLYREWGDKPSLSFEAKEHYELGEDLDQMDFETATKISGSRFVILSKDLARLERALGQMMLDLHTGEHGYDEVSVPLLVNDETMYGTGQLPKFSEDLFKTTDGRWMIPTAEVSLTNIVRGEVMDHSYLPRRYTALTHCFRSEAGSAGRDTRGMLRQHQFSKVELVSIVDDKSGLDELERMLGCAEKVLQKLNLHYRVVTLCTGDMGFGARKTYDIEVWVPGQNTYREISSCSFCGDFQGLRMNARYRVEGEKKLNSVHTLNGSGIAVGRALIAVLENYQNEDGSITVPEALVPYMGGKTSIGSEAKA
ncbi:MAG: serine--tRNA ligase [Nitratireductor sp.]